jgi:hypothetical protein
MAARRSLREPPDLPTHLASASRLDAIPTETTRLFADAERTHSLIDESLDDTIIPGEPRVKTAAHRRFSEAI